MEKAVKSNKRIILLRLFCAALSLLFVICPSILSVSAADVNENNFIDFNEYATYSYSDDNTSVIAEVVFPDFFNNTFVATGGREYWFTGNSFFVENLGNQMKIRMYPISGYTNKNMGVGVQLSDTNILDLRYIPNGSTLTYSFTVGLSASHTVLEDYTHFFRAFYFVDKNGKIIKDERHYFYPEYSRGIYTWEESYTLDIPSGAVGLIPQFWISDLPVYADSCEIVLNPFRFELPMSALEFESMQNQQIKDTLKSVEQALEKQGQQLEELPSQIGDEFESVIEQEKEESKQEGNKFVDQVLEQLPDPSQGVLSALGELTSAVGYTGTEAVISFPAIVIPGIDGLFDEIVIYEGSDFDLGSCVSYIPENILTVIQSLFTIAIVLYCVYELKGIISFIFTLKEKNNG